MIMFYTATQIAIQTLLFYECHMACNKYGEYANTLIFFNGNIHVYVYMYLYAHIWMVYSVSMYLFALVFN